MTVIAATDTSKLVRNDKTRKYAVEGDNARANLSTAQAAEIAAEWINSGTGSVWSGLNKAFDKALDALEPHDPRWVATPVDKPSVEELQDQFAVVDGQRQPGPFYRPPVKRRPSAADRRRKARKAARASRKLNRVR